MNPATQPNHEPDDDWRPLTASERANQRWGKSDNASRTSDSGAVDAPKLQALEGGGEGDGTPAGNLHAVGDTAATSASSLAAAEAGFGFNPNDSDGDKSKLLKKLSNKSRLKKRLALAGLLGGGGILGGVFVFMAMLPLKIENIVTNVQNTFSSASNQAVGNETENLFERYVVKQVLPNLGPACRYSTAHPGCTAAKAAGSGPISTLYNSWREGNIENKLATRYNIAFEKRGSTYFINTSAGNLDLGTHPTSILGKAGTSSATRTEVRAALKNALQEETLWKRVFLRFKFGKFLETKYGVKRCVIACKFRDNFSDNIKLKKQAAKAFFTRKIIMPLNENYGLIMQCILNGGCDPEHLQSAKDGDTTRQTDFQKNLQAQLDSFEARNGEKALADLVKQADDVGKDGFTKYFAKKIAGELGAKVAEKGVPVVGWALLISHLLELGQKIGPMVKYMGYAANSAAAVRLYEMYTTAVSETHSGHMDATELGSLTDALGSNVTGSTGDQSDITQTPLYSSLFGGNSSSGAVAFIDNFLPQTAYASTQYLCNDGKPVPAGQIVCSEEKLDAGNDTANNISKAVCSITCHIPGFNAVLSAINKAGNVIGSALGSAFNSVCGVVPGCSNGVKAVGEAGSKLTLYMAQQMIPSPFSNNMSGGRTGDMIIGGGDASYNSACRDVLGCQQIDNATVAAIRNQQASEEKASFAKQPLFARLFSTASPYSLVSRLAVAMPSNAQTFVSGGVLNLLSGTTKGFGSLFSSIFASKGVSAATQPAADPFGITQYGYPTDQIPSDPEAFWQNNCVNGPYGTYSNGNLDISAWLNDNNNVSFDQNTGEALYKKTNPCLLIQASVQSAGAMFNSALIPAGASNSDVGS